MSTTPPGTQTTELELEASPAYRTQLVPLPTTAPSTLRGSIITVTDERQQVDLESLTRLGTRARPSSMVSDERSVGSFSFPLPPQKPLFLSLSFAQSDFLLGLEHSGMMYRDQEGVLRRRYLDGGWIAIGVFLVRSPSVSSPSTSAFESSLLLSLSTDLPRCGCCYCSRCTLEIALFRDSWKGSGSHARKRSNNSTSTRRPVVRDSLSLSSFLLEVLPYLQDRFRKYYCTGSHFLRSVWATAFLSLSLFNRTKLSDLTLLFDFPRGLHSLLSNPFTHPPSLPSLSAPSYHHLTLFSIICFSSLPSLLDPNPSPTSRVVFQSSLLQPSSGRFF